MKRGSPFTWKPVKIWAVITTSIWVCSQLNCSATISFTGSYTENFDTLASSGSGNAWANDTTLSGWSLFNRNGAAISTYNAGEGSVNTGNFYSFGTSTSTERSLGGVGSGGTYFGSPANGAIAGYIAVALQNASGSDFNSFTISYNGEQWRDGGNTTPQTMVMQYGFGATFALVSWTSAGSSFDFTSLQNSASATALDGNATGNRKIGIGGNVQEIWKKDTILWIRWIENNDTGNDHGLAIDDFSITTPKLAAVPEASTLYAGFGLSLGLVVSFVRKLRK